MAANPNDITLLSGKQMNVSFTSNPICVIRNISFSFQAVWTGSPTGIMSVQSSDDSAEDQVNILPTNWNTIRGASYNVVAIDGKLTFSWKDPQLPINWIRWVWTATSGAGLLQTLNFNGR